MSLGGLDYLLSLRMFGVRPGLLSTEKLCASLGNPEKAFRTVHIVGTNGKGSTSFYLANVLSSHGVKVALYTSPHLVSIRERLRFENRAVSEEELDEALLSVKEASEKEGIIPTYFEALTISAFLICRARGIEILVAEAGLGGRFDATAVAKGSLALLSGVGLEHTEILGKTEEEILVEKVNILQSGSTLISATLSNSLNQFLLKFSKEKKIEVFFPEAFPVRDLPNLGNHYKENARLALSGAKIILREKFDLSRSLLALKNSFWAGRMQMLFDDSGLRWILDGAHNSHAIKRLSETLKEKFPGEKFHAIFGVLKDKDLSEMIRELSSSISVWHPSNTSYERFLPFDSLEKELSAFGLETGTSGELSKEFLEKIKREAGNKPILVTGSLYLIGSVIELLKNDFEALAFFRDMTPEPGEKHIFYKG